MSMWVAVYRWAWGLVFVALAVAVLGVFVRRGQAIQELQRRKAEAAARNAEVERATQDLREKRERFMADPVFVERVARESGLARPDEIVFKFSGDLEPAQP